MNKFSAVPSDPQKKPVTEGQTQPRRPVRPVAAPLRRVAHVREPLSPQALEMLDRLRAEEASAGVLADRFPHVINRLAANWGAPNEALAQISELLVDRRGNRQGFPRDALAELLALQRCSARKVETSSGR